MKHLGLVGNPVRHSMSPRLFEEKFQLSGIEGDYRLFELPTLDGLRALVEANGLDGFNVTSPYKQQVIAFLDDLSDCARSVGAVNTVVVRREHGKLSLCGHNTDVEGFKTSLLSLLGGCCCSALVFGNGGASRAVTYALQQLGIEYVVVARKPKVGELDWQLLTPHHVADNKLLINCTTIGMGVQCEELLPLDYASVSSSHFAYDLIYNPLQTPFLSCCARRGAAVVNGWQMLCGQAEAAWRLWCAEL